MGQILGDTLSPLITCLEEHVGVSSRRSGQTVVLSVCFHVLQFNVPMVVLVVAIPTFSPTLSSESTQRKRWSA